MDPSIIILNQLKLHSYSREKVMTISERLRKDAGNIWKKIFEHPFVTELYKGSLPIEKFRFYTLQDYNYLISAIRNFSIIASKSDTVKAMREVIEILHLESVSEFRGYEKSLKELGYTLTDAVSIQPIPMNVSYVNFLLSTSSLKSYAEAITSVLPCFWSYGEIANYHKEKLKNNTIKIYVDWASVYFSKHYLNLVRKLRNLVDEAGNDFPYKKLKSAFITASRYEYMYWDAIYNTKNWPI